jgi:hypothetical protein
MIGHITTLGFTKFDLIFAWNGQQEEAFELVDFRVQSVIFL